MVVAALLGLALALPTGALFGIGYGTGVRIGYEQVYPLLFPADKRGDASSVALTMKGINKIYDTVGGKEASQMGIAQGIIAVSDGIKNNPDFQALEERELKLSGVTSLNIENQKQFALSLAMFQESLKEGHAITKGDRRDTSSDAPATILDIPIIAGVDVPGAIQGPPAPGNRFGYAAMTKTELLNNQPGFMQPRPSNIAEREVEWGYYYSRIAQSEKDARDSNAPTIIQPTKSSNQILTDTYNKTKTTLINQIHVFKNSYDGWLNPLSSSSQGMSKNSMTGALTNTSNVVKARSYALNSMENLKKKLINHITLARNNLATKSQANNDWNNRIWKI